MKRAIRMRGKSIRTGEWVYGYYVVMRPSNEEARHLIYPDKSNNASIINGETGETYFNAVFEQVRPETVGQYAGANDKNGEMIYEGDILAHAKANPHVIMHVVSEGSQYCCIQHWDGADGNGSIHPIADYDMADWFVVGNIHDIPELIAYGAITEADNEEMNEKYPPRDEDIAFIGNKMN